MQRVIATCLLVFLGIIVSPSSAEIRLVCPRPLTPDSAIQSGPCGNGLNEPFGNNFMEISPGPMTIKMENTAWRYGSPTRIALLDRNNPSKECVILDNIPDNQGALFQSSNPNCSINTHPIGECKYSTRYITVEIPNIDCPQCLLQVTQIVTAGTPCERNSQGRYNCTVFHSCSNVQIRQTPGPVRFTIDHCTDHYRSLSNVWPFYPGRIYETNFTGTPFESGYARFIDTGSLIRYEISIFNPTAIVRGAGVYRAATDGRTFKAHWDGTSGEYVGTFSETGTSIFRQSVSTVVFGPCYRDPTAGYRCPKYPIILSKHIEENIYKNNYLLYDGHGWLNGDAFASKIQTFARGVYPNGPCIQNYDVDEYGTFLRGDAGTIGGIVTFKVTNFIFHVTGSLAARNTSAWSVNLFTATEGRMNIPKRYIKGTEFRTSRDYWRFKGVNNGGLPVRVLANQIGGLQGLAGDFSRVIKAEIIKDGILHGMVILTLVGSTDIRFQLVVSNYQGRVSRFTSVTIRGPSLNMDQGGVGLDLTPYIQVQGGLGPVWWMDRTVTLEDTRLALYLLSGYAYIHLEGDSQFYTGQFEPPVNFCQNTDHLFCKVVELTNSNPILDSMPTRATVSFLRSGYILTYGVWIRNLKPEEVVLALYVRNSVRITQQLGGPIFGNRDGSPIKIETGSIYPNENTAEALRTGQLSFVIETAEQQIVRTMTGLVPWLDPTWEATEIPQTTTSTQRITTTTPTTQAPLPTTVAPPPITAIPESTTQERRTNTELPETVTQRRATTTEMPQPTTLRRRTTTELPRTVTQRRGTTTELLRTTTLRRRTTTELPKNTTQRHATEGRSTRHLISPQPSTAEQTTWLSQTPPSTTTSSAAWATQQPRWTSKQPSGTSKTGPILNDAESMGVALPMLCLAVLLNILYQ